MSTAGMGVDEIGIGALDPIGEIVAHEQIQDPVNAVGGDPFAPRAREIVGNIIGRGWLLMLRQLFKNQLPHARPLLARIGKSGLSCLDQTVAGVFLMIVLMVCHAQELGRTSPPRKPHRIFAGDLTPNPKVFYAGSNGLNCGGSLPDKNPDRAASTPTPWAHPSAGYRGGADSLQQNPDDRFLRHRICAAR